MNLIPLILLLTFLTMPSYCQNVIPIFIYKNNAQVEVGGHGLFYSLNYERVLLNGQKFKTTGQIGFAYYPPKSGIINIWMPALINELISFNQHHIELGFGYVFTNEAIHGDTIKVSSREWGGFIAGKLGYIYKKPSGRLIMRVSFTPLIGYVDNRVLEVHPLGGLSLGYSFGK